MKGFAPIIALALAVGRAPAQTPCVFDTAAHRDTAAIILSVRVHPAADTITNTAASELLAAVLRERWHPPSTIGRMFYPYTTYAGKPSLDTRSPFRSIAPALPMRPLPGETIPGTRAHFAVGDNGRLRELAVVRTSGDSATDASLLAAIAAADSAGDLAALGDLLESPVRGGIIELIGGTELSAGIARTHVNRTIIETPGDFVSASAPRYPEQDKRAGRQGFAMLRYIIDERGLIDPGSLYVLEATNERFAQAARDAVMKDRFKPARTGGCPVKSVVVQRVLFGLNSTNVFIR